MTRRAAAPPRRVVITGLGPVTPVGLGRDEYWHALLEARTGFAPVQRFDTSAFRSHVGAEVKNFDFSRFANYAEADRPIGKASQLAIAAAELAVQDAKLDLASVDHSRVGVAVGTTAGEIQVLEDANDIRHQFGQEAVSAETLRWHPVNNIPANVGIHFGLQGFNTMIPTACAAGNYTIGYAADLISLGRIDYMLAGGSDPFSRVAFTGFIRLGAVAPEVCQPFDKNRRGMMVGEGAGILLLESLESALERGATIYAEVLGYGLSCDGHHMTQPHPEGLGVVQAMEKALSSAGVAPDEVAYVNAHGTGTEANDKAETVAIKRVMGDHAKRVLVSSTKSMIGHTMGAAGALEAIACCLATQNDIAPPTANFETPDPECDIDCVPNKPREARIEIALNNAYAFGGNNSSLVLRKYAA